MKPQPKQTKRGPRLSSEKRGGKAAARPASAPKAKPSAASAPPVKRARRTARKPAARPRQAPRAPALAIPPLLLEGDDSPVSTASGPGQRYDLGSATPAEQGGQKAPGALPEAYGTRRLSLTARDPHWLYAAWDFTREQLRRYNRRTRAGHLALRVYRDAPEGTPVTEVELHPESRFWFVHVEDGGSSYVVQLGYYGQRRRWIAVATSDRATTPPAGLAEESPVQFRTIPASDLPPAPETQDAAEAESEATPSAVPESGSREQPLEGSRAGVAQPGPAMALSGDRGPVAAVDHGAPAPADLLPALADSGAARARLETTGAAVSPAPSEGAPAPVGEPCQDPAANVAAETVPGWHPPEQTAPVGSTACDPPFHCVIPDFRTAVSAARDAAGSSPLAPPSAPTASPNILALRSAAAAVGAVRFPKVGSGVAPSPEWTPQQAEALARLVNWEEARRGLANSNEIVELLRRRAQAGIVTAGAELASGLGAGEAGLAEIGGGVSSAEAPFGGPPQPGAFWFNVNAELIIYGATEPGARVTVDGRPIQLRPDGTFSLRLALPDGEHEVKLRAVSADQTESRAAELRFHRTTQYRGKGESHLAPPPAPPTPSDPAEAE